MRSQPAKPSNIPGGLVYPARWFLTTGIALWAFAGSLVRALGNAPGDILAAWLMQLDVYRDLFYGICLAWLILTLVPAGRPLSRLRSWQQALFAVALAVICLSPLVWLALTSRSQIQAGPLLASFIPLALTALTAQPGSGWTAKFGRYAIGVADWLTPLAVWRHYASANRALVLMKPLSMVFPLLLPPVVLSIYTQPQNAVPGGVRAECIIPDSGLYQSAFDTETRRLWVTDDKHTLYLVNVLSGEQVQMRIDSPQFQYIGFDFGKRKAFHIPLHMRRLMVFDMDDPAEVDVREIRAKLDKTQIFPTSREGLDRLVISTETRGALILSPDGDVLTRNTELGTTAYAVWDEKRGLLYVAPYEQSRIVALDGRTLEITGEIGCPRQAGHMALSADGDTLWTCFPWQGQVRALDLEDFTFSREADVTPGVRVLELDEVSGLLFAGGFSPYLDVLRLDDLKVAARYAVPGWHRDMYADQESKRLYITTRNHGLWVLDYGDLAKDPDSASARPDPFLWLVRVAGSWIYDTQAKRLFGPGCD